MCATVVEIMNRKIMMMEGWNRDDTICPTLAILWQQGHKKQFITTLYTYHNHEY